MSDIRSINIPGPIRTFTPQDTYPTHEANNGLGGWHTIDSSAYLDSSISDDRKLVGMSVFCVEDNMSYILLKDKDNNKVWVPSSEIISNTSKTNQNVTSLNTIDELFPGEYEDNQISPSITAYIDEKLTTKADKVRVQHVVECTATPTTSTISNPSTDILYHYTYLNSDKKTYSDKFYIYDGTSFSENKNYILPNIFYVWDTELTSSNTVKITLDSTSTTDLSIYNEYMFQITTGGSTPTLVFPEDLEWHGEPTFFLATTHQISIVNNVAIITPNDNNDGFEKEANKVSTLANPSNTTYPTSKCVSDAIDALADTIGPTTIGESFTTNVTCGAIAAGTTIDGTTSIISLIKKMLLTKLLASIKAYPKVAITNSGTSTNASYEVGTTITPSLGYVYSDASFNSYESNDGYTVSVIKGGCAQTSYSYYKKEGDNGTNGTYTGGSFQIKEGNTYISVTVKHSASTTTAHDSDGTSSSISIASGEVSSSSLKYIGLYGYFFKTFDSAQSEYTRSLLGSPTIMTKQSFDVVFDRKENILAIPAVWGDIAHAIFKSNNADQIGEAAKSSISLTDAGGNDVNYILYVFHYDIAPSNQTTTISF